MPTPKSELRRFAVQEPAEAANRIAELEAVLSATEHDLTGLAEHYLTPIDGSHQRHGEACGIDACILCLCEGTAQAALNRIRDALKGEQHG